jgi:hypothetical protein
MMLFKGNIGPAAEVLVECSAPAANAPKLVLVTVAEVPEPGKPVLTPHHALIAPGAAVTIKTRKLSGLALRVDIDVPEPGSADIRVSQDGVVCVDTTNVTEDEKWLFSVA